MIIVLKKIQNNITKKLMSNKQTMRQKMKKFLNWYKEDTPVLAMSNKQMVWFAIISLIAAIIKIKTL